MKRPVCCWRAILLAAVAPWFGQIASAQDDFAAAGEAYQRAQTAELAGQHGRAAELYELANHAAPSAQALRGAVRMRRAAGHSATAMTHAERLLRRYPEDQASRELAEMIFRELQGRLVRVHVECDAPCRPTVDGRLSVTARGTEHVLYVSPGSYQFAAAFEAGRSDAQSETGRAGQRIELSFQAPPEEEVADGGSAADGTLGEEDAWAPETARDEADEEGEGLPPWVFIAGLSTTVLLGGVTVWSGLDVLDAHDSYDRTAPDAEERFSDGESRELRTNILIGATVAAAAFSAVALVFTDWSSDEEESADVAVSSNGVSMMYKRRW